MSDSGSPSLAGRELFLKALRCEPVPRPPVWFLRQSGRYLPEFRELRKRHRFEDLLREPELAAEATALPLRRFPLDCAILFSDITAPFLDTRLGLEFREGVGPVFVNRLPIAKLVDEVSSFDTPLRLAECVRASRREFPGLGFVGFAGGPYTLAAYLLGSPVEEGAKRLAALAESDPVLAESLLLRLAALAGDFLKVQAEAGADALMLFDTWAGPAGPELFSKLAHPFAADAVARAKRTGRPVIYYTRNSAGIISMMPRIGADAISLDDSIDLRVARDRLPRDICMQGNLDPVVFEKDDAAVEAAVETLLSESRGIPGHIFNTARGIGPGASADLVAKAVDLVTSSAKVVT